MRYCVNCGAMNDTDAKYCSGCGKKFDSAPADDGTKTDYTRNAESTNSTFGAAPGAGQNSYGSQNTYSAGQNSYNSYGTSQNTYRSSYQSDFVDDKTKGYSIASLILGICSIVFSWWIPILPLAAAIVGLILGNKAKAMGDNGMAKAGRITSIIGIILIALMVVLAIIGVALFSTAIIENPEIFENLDRYYDMFN